MAAILLDREGEDLPCLDIRNSDTGLFPGDTLLMRGVSSALAVMTVTVDRLEPWDPWERDRSVGDDDDSIIIAVLLLRLLAPPALLPFGVVAVDGDADDDDAAVVLFSSLVGLLPP